MSKDDGHAESFEELLGQFDDAVASLESDQLSLETALEKYEAAVMLADRCARLLANAELRVREIDKTLQHLDGDPEAEVESG